MHLIRRDTNATVCPPSVPFCKPSIGPGPALVESQNANALIRQPTATDNDTEVDVDAGSEAEINVVGVVVIVIILLVLLVLWAGLASWPRGKIKAWLKRRSAKGVERARKKALSTNATADTAIAEGLASTTSAVDLTQADIESAVSMINNGVAKELRTVPSAPPLEKNVSEASTVVEKEARIPTKGSPEVQETVNLAPVDPSRAVVRDSSWPRLPFISPSSPLFGSMTRKFGRK